MIKKAKGKHHPYTRPCIWIAQQTLHFPLLGESGDLKTTINTQEFAENDGRSNEWNGFDQDDQNTASNIWDDK
jgi:hypothetical protein